MPTTHLSWQPGFSLSRKPAKRSVSRRIKRGVLDNADGIQQFEFIAEHPVGDYRAAHYPFVKVSIALTNDDLASSDPGIDSLPIVNRPENKHAVVSNEHRAHPESEHPEEPGPSIETPSLTWNGIVLIESDEPSVSNTSFETTRSFPTCESEEYCANSHIQDPTISGQSQIHGRSSQAAFAEHVSVASSDLCDTSCSPVPLTAGILYSDLSQRFRPVLERYNNEFCKIPLTSDLLINPFRYRTEIEMEPGFLVHAVMALAGHHIQSTLTQNHRHASLQLLRTSLNQKNTARAGYVMLDTIILLFSLDETQSAFGNWSTHLLGAYSILEAYGGINYWAASVRTQAQVGILTWWDATVSLISREDCVFPYSYFEAMLSEYDDRQWDFFGLCGCPLSLVKIVMQLARLSAEKQKSSLMRYVAFDNTAVAQLERSLESWNHVSSGTVYPDEECMQQDRDSMHCSEAWRNGLLLYVYRVFQWGPGSSVPMHILYRARCVVDHVLACREESMVSRQALLPLFFAGCELRDRSTRRKILESCSIWNRRTRYHVFGSTIPLLKEVWAEQEMRGLDNVWWGQIVDRHHASDFGCLVQKRLCFG